VPNHTLLDWYEMLYNKKDLEKYKYNGTDSQLAKQYAQEYRNQEATTRSKRSELVRVIKEYLDEQGISTENAYNFEDINGSNLDYWSPNIETNTEISKIAGRLIGVLQIVGSIISVIAVVIIGIKYLFGSIEEKVKYKETMMPYLVGCIMLFAISNITSILYKIGISFL